MCQKQLLLEHLGTVSRLHGNQRFANARAKSLLEQLSALLRVSCRTCQQGLDIALSQAVMLRKRRIQMRSSAVHNLRIPIRTAPELALPGGLWPGGLGQECFLERTQRLSGSCPTHAICCTMPGKRSRFNRRRTLPKDSCPINRICDNHNQVELSHLASLLRLA